MMLMNPMLMARLWVAFMWGAARLVPAMPPTLTPELPERET